MRDITREARQWRSYLRADNPLSASLADVSDDTLTEAYQTWWNAYTTGIRESPSSRRPEGVAASDAKNAAAVATSAVLELLGTR